VANRNNGRRGRSRKRSRKRATAAVGPAEAAVGALASPPEEQQDARAPASAGASQPNRTASAKAPKRQRSRPAAGERGTASRGFKDPQSLGERPQAPWHPVPVSELLILVGAIGTVVGLSKGASHGGPALIVGLAAVIVGTLEFALREHRSGYRAHTVLLALLPTVIVYTGTLLIVAAFVTPVPVGLKIAPLALALPLFTVMFKLLRGRFRDARRERVFAGDR
jgi:hypothetical protein